MSRRVDDDGGVRAGRRRNWAPDVDALLVPRRPQKISLRDEWALAAFTFVAVVLTAWQGAAALGGPSVRPLAVLALAVAAMGLSTAHLGPTRAGVAGRTQLAALVAQP